MMNAQASCALLYLVVLAAYVVSVYKHSVRVFSFSFVYFICVDCLIIEKSVLSFSHQKKKKRNTNKEKEQNKEQN